MLVFLATTLPQPAEDVLDRDPGILTLAAALVNAWQRRLGRHRDNAA
ncbi:MULTISPECIES: hypothetical protein [unclassified Methylobacterium]|nr:MULTISPECIES: hypothetical protein [unclassified Methylobacterium]